jgi:hypothetical protein
MQPIEDGGRAFSLSESEERAGEQSWKEWKAADFRKFMGWIYCVTSLQYLTISVRSVPYAIRGHYSLSFVSRMLTAPVISTVMAVVSGVACWTIWKGKSSARGWAIASSLVLILICIRQFIIPLRLGWDHGLVSLLTGVVGLIAFLRPEKQADT